MAITKVKGHNRKFKGKRVRVRPYSRRATISKRKRKVFTDMAQQPYELGGQMDFERGELQKAGVHFGNAYGVEYEYDPDQEVDYHTHPAESMMPSYDDIISMKLTKQNEGIIFYNNRALSISEDKKFRQTSRTKIRSISNQLQRDFERGMSDKDLYNKYRPIFKKELGLNMIWHNPDRPIRLKSRSV